MIDLLKGFLLAVFALSYIMLFNMVYTMAINLAKLFSVVEKLLKEQEETKTKQTKETK